MNYGSRSNRLNVVVALLFVCSVCATCLAQEEPKVRKPIDIQNLFSASGWMGDGTFDKGLLSHLTGGVDAVEPALIGTPALWQALARKEAHMTAHRGQVGTLFQCTHLHGQALAVHEIVSIHTGDQAPTAVCQARVQGWYQPLVCCCNHRKARVLGGKPAGPG